MAYMNQDRKSELAPAIKAACAKYGVKASLSVGNHSSLSLNIKSGPIDLIGNLNDVCRHAPGADRYGTYREAVGHVQVNEYHYQNHFSGEALAFLSEVIQLMNVGNHDRSDIQSDYFDVGWYTHINIGSWNKHYMVTA